MDSTPAFGTRHALIPSVKNKAPQCRGIPQGTTPPEQQGGNMKRLLSLVLLTGCLAIPSFASDAVGHSVKVAGKDSAKAVTVTAKHSAKAVKAVGKFLF
jgi:hypothetical protein